MYLNADELEATIRRDGGVQLTGFGVETTAAEVLPFFTQSDFLRGCGREQAAQRLRFTDDWLDFSDVTVDSYLASALVDFLRTRLLAGRVSLTFETVMSHRSKVEVLEHARQIGYRTYLYYVATDDPAINVSRVQNRVKLNGHDVPADVVERRYYRSLKLLWEAIRHTDRAYLFDNSTDNADRRQTWLAEVTDGSRLELKTDRIPAWFRREVLDRIPDHQRGT